jgi:hypothetical protein
VDFSGKDYRLAEGSVCIDSGLYQSWMDGALDLDGNPRIDWSGGIVDRGCFEYTPLKPRGSLITIQ